MDAYNGKIAQLIVDKFKAEVWAELQLQALLDVQQADAEPVGRDLTAGQLPSRSSGNWEPLFVISSSVSSGVRQPVICTVQVSGISSSA